MRSICLILFFAACAPPLDTTPKMQTPSTDPPQITAPTQLPAADAREHPATGNSWSVLVYMVADNDLEPFALEDLLEMAAVGSATGLEILVQADRSVDYSNAGVLGFADFTSTKRLRITQGAITEVADLGELNMGDPATLADFIEWGVKYKASDRYAIVFWDHGGGWPGFGGDGSTATMDQLSLAELQSGLQTGMSRAGLSQFALIGFDACLMATYETAMVVRTFGEYLLASEELEPGHGWDWAKLALLKQSPTASPKALGEAMIDGFLQQALVKDTQESVTLSLVDLYALDGVHAAVTTLADSLRSNVGRYAAALGRERAGTLRFGDNPNPAAAVNMVDLGLLVAGLAAQEPSLSSTAQALNTALAKAVVKSRNGAARKGATGLSIYLPPIDNYDTRYGALSEVIKGWQRLLGELTGTAGIAQLGAAPEFIAGAIDAWGVGGVRVRGELKAGGGASIAEASLVAGVIDGSTLYAFVEIPASVSGDIVSGEWAASVLTVTQGNTADYGFLSLSSRDGYNIALIPFLYRRTAGGTGEIAGLMIVLDAADNEVSRTLYLFADSGPGQLTPAAGSTLEALILAQPTNGSAGTWQLAPASAVFDATLPLTIDVVALDAGTDAGAVLVATDAASRSALRFFSQPL